MAPPQDRPGMHGLWIFALMATAGLLNAGGILRYGETLSHHTGNLSKMGLAAAGGDRDTLLRLFGLVLAYFCGATLSGIAFPRYTSGDHRSLGALLAGLGTCVLLAEALLLPSIARAAALALVLGGQNGLALRYRGVLTRTTHMTGHLTDCGAALGRVLLRAGDRTRDRHLFFFHFLCLLCFFLGALAAFLADPLLSPVPGLGATLAGALAYLALGAGQWLTPAFNKSAGRTPVS